MSFAWRGGLAGMAAGMNRRRFFKFLAAVAVSPLLKETPTVNAGQWTDERYWVVVSCEPKEVIDAGRVTVTLTYKIEKR